jgi:hypothetical protein
LVKKLLCEKQIFFISFWARKESIMWRTEGSGQACKNLFCFCGNNNNNDNGTKTTKKIWINSFQHCSWTQNGSLPIWSRNGYCYSTGIPIVFTSNFSSFQKQYSDWIWSEAQHFPDGPPSLTHLQFIFLGTDHHFCPIRCGFVNSRCLLKGNAMWWYIHFRDFSYRSNFSSKNMSEYFLYFLGGFG